MAQNDAWIVEFESRRPNEWRVVNDGVMGGLSQSRMRITPDDTGVFEGHVSLENNGGFAMVRLPLDRLDLSRYAAIAVRVKGDGHRYRLRLRTDQSFDGVAYQASFETRDDEWQVIELPLSGFEPTFRGRRVADAPPLDAGRIYQLGFMIADQQEGVFRLEVDWVRARE